MEIKIATFNLKNDNLSALSTHWSRRKNSVKEFLKTENPHILGTQELNYARIGEMLEMVPAFDYIGEGRAGGKNGEYCAIFYRKDLYRCEEGGTFWLSKHPEQRKSRGWLAMFPRICTWGRFIHIETGKEIIILNTHLDVISPYARADGLIQIAKFVRKEFKGKPVALMGDFNAKPESKAVKYITEASDESGVFTDSSYSVFYSLESPFGRTYHGFNGKVVGLPIDYIFTTKDLHIEEAFVVQKRFLGKYPSDHFPIIMKCYIE